MKTMSSHPITVNYMDIFDIIFCKNCTDVHLKKTENRQKEAGDGQFKNR